MATSSATAKLLNLLLSYEWKIQYSTHDKVGLVHHSHAAVLVLNREEDPTPPDYANAAKRLKMSVAQLHEALKST